jgi:coenzyme F420-reducing hydrogenase alpha subunit
MVIYNVTVKISNQAHDEWLHWMKTKHIPDVMATEKFDKHVFTKVMVDDPEGTNYSIQYYCKDLDTLADYQDNHAPALQVEHTEKFKDQFVAFRTILEMV